MNKKYDNNNIIIIASRAYFLQFSASSTSKAACRVLHLLAPSASSASRLPGFGDSSSLGMPPLLVEGSIERMPEHIGGDVLDAEALPQLPLFREAPRPLLSTPPSPPPLRAAARRKTLARVNIQRTVTYSIRRADGHSSSKRATRSVAKETETLLYKGLSILQEGEEANELALHELERRFDGQIPDDVLKDLRIMFDVYSQEAEEVDNARIGHAVFLAFSGYFSF
jgi:hypothetical protein